MSQALLRRKDRWIDPLAGVSPRALAKLIRRVKRRPEILLEISHARGVITRERFTVMSGAMTTLGADTPGAATNTLAYNLESMAGSVDSDRPEWLVYPLVGIERLRKRRKTARVLSIGPRGEYEIFTLQAIGFRPENIKSLDLFSYSPLTDIGDMHAMPYDAGSFDLIVLAWVWSYSRDWQTLAAEVRRIAAPGAVVCISADTPAEDRPPDDTFEGTISVVRSCDDMLAPFGAAVANVYFRQDSELPEVTGNMVIFDLRAE